MQDIKRCTADVFLLPNMADLNQDGVPIRYALYRLIVDGLHRYIAAWSLQAQNAAQTPVTLGTYIREFEWYNGNPYWVASGARYNSIVGMERLSQQGKWTWYWQNTFHSWCTNLEHE